MLSFFDPKPLGAFIEYSVRPLIQDSIELLNLCEERNIDPNQIIRQSWKLFIFKSVFDFLSTLMVTGAICFTILKVFSSQNLGL